MKLLGLDIGEKRIGVAISENQIANIYGLIINDELGSVIAEISKIVRQENIEKIIIGIPKNRDSLQIDKIHKFALELAKNLNLEVIYIDETLTSKEAERLLGKKLDPRLQKYKEEVDKLSAKLILEQYLTENAKCKSQNAK